MLNIKKLHEQSKSVRLAKKQAEEKAEEKAEPLRLGLVEGVFPCFILEGEEKIKTAASEGERVAYIRLQLGEEFDRPCYEMLFSRAK